MQVTNNNLVDRQRSLLHAFAKVSHVLNGVVALLWLPGLRQKFNGPRAVRGTRPLCVSLEVTANGGLALSGAIARPKQGRLRFDSIFRYDFTQPMAEKASGSCLSSRNTVIANRALSLLASLVRFGERRVYQPRQAELAAPRWPSFLVPFNPGEQVFDEAKLTEMAADMAPELVEMYREKLRQGLTDSTTLPGTVLVNSAIVPDAYIVQALSRELGYEDYSPVLGVPHWNPAQALREQANPATALLAAHGITDLEAVTHEQLDRLAADFRSAVALGECFADEEVYDALVHPESAATCSSLANATPDRLVEAMRRAAGSSRAAREATDADLMEAAHSDGRLVISTLSATQICAVEAVEALPAPYTGSVLAPLDWEPPRRGKAAIAAA